MKALKTMTLLFLLGLTALTSDGCSSQDHRSPEGDYPSVPYDTPRKFVPMNYFISPEIEKMDDQTVAVLLFQNASANPPAALSAADLANLHLGTLNRYRLVERLRVEELYKEQDFSPSRIDDATAAKIGKMLGAKAVILGTVLEFDAGRVGISMRMVDVETGLQLWQARDTLDSRDPRVEDLANNRYMDRALKKDANFLMDLLIKGLVSSLRP